MKRIPFGVLFVALACSVAAAQSIVVVKHKGPILPSTVSITGSCSSATASCTLSATKKGDLKIFFSYRHNSNTAPTTPAGFTSVQASQTTAGGVPAAARLYCSVATDPTDTGSGTPPNGTQITGVSLSGTQVDATGDCGGTGTGARASANGKLVTTVNYAGLVGGSLIHNTDGTSFALGFSGTDQATPCLPTAYTAVGSPAGTGPSVIQGTGGAVSSWAAATCTITSGTYLSMTLEILGNAPSAAIKEVQHSAVANSSAATTAVQTMTITTGDTVVAIGSSLAALPAGVAVTSTSGCLWMPTNRSDFLATTGTGHLNIFYCRNHPGGSDTVTLTNTSSNLASLMLLEYSGISSTNPWDTGISVLNTVVNPWTGTFSVEDAGSLVLEAATWDTATELPLQGTGFGNLRLIPPNGNGTTNQTIVVASQINTTAGSAAYPGITNPSVANGLLQYASFKAGGAGTGVQLKQKNYLDSATFAASPGTAVVPLKGVVAGNSLVCGLMYQTGLGTISSFTDGAGHGFAATTHTPVTLTVNAITWYLGFLSRAVSAGGDLNITLQLTGGTGTGKFQMVCGEFSPLAFDLDVAGVTGTGTPVNTPSITTTQTDTIFCEATLQSTAVSMGAGWTNFDISQEGNAIEVARNQPAGTYTTNILPTATGAWGSLCAAFH